LLARTARITPPETGRDDTLAVIGLLMIGKTISHYKILEKLGEGGMGVVYKAVDTKLDRAVALKFLPRHLLADPEAKKRFINEAKATSALDHVNIATVYEIGEEDDQNFIAMAYIEGKTLGDLVEMTPLKIDEITDIAIQVCEGLAAAHKKQVVHRDIKSDNIMITTDGVVKIMDFGLAKLSGASRMTRTGTTMGTIYYMSPEQIQGVDVDQRSDIFSFGVVLYELITRKLPFLGDHEQAVIFSIMSTDPKPLAELRDDVPAELQKIVNKALEKETSRRYQSVDEMLEDLKSLKEAPSGKVARRPLPIPRLSRKLFLGAAGLAVVAALFIGTRIHMGGGGTATTNSLAVMYFDNVVDPNDSRKLGEIVTNLLITDLSESQHLRVVSSQRLYDILRLLGKEETGRIEKSVATQVAEKANAKWMLLVVTAQLVDVGSGNAVASQRIDGGAEETIFSIVDRLSAQLRKDLSLPGAAQGEVDRPVAEVTTHSEDAYRDYLEGMGYFYRHYWAEAEESFNKAIAEDSTLAMAYYRLSVMGVQKGDPRARELGLKAAKYIDRAGQKDRHYIASWRELMSGNLTQGAAELQEIVDRYPNEKEARFWLGALYWRAFGDPQKAIPYLTEAVELDPLYEEPYNILAYAYDRVGDFEKSIWAINKYISLAPGEANPYDSRAMLYGFNGKVDLAIESYKKALETKPGFYPSLRGLGHMYAFKGDFEDARDCYEKLASNEDSSIRAEARTDLALIPMFQGKLSEATRMLDRLIADDEREGVHGIHEANKFMLKASIYKELGDFKEAIKQTEAEVGALQHAYPGAQMKGQADYATTLAEGGEIARAEETAESLKVAIGRKDESLMFLYWRALGSIEAAKGDYDGAIEQIQKAIKEASAPSFGARYSLAGIYLESGKLGEAVDELESALSRYDEERALVPLSSVKAHYALGMAYERSGWTSKAIEQYETFLQIWGDADPGIASVDDAKARLSHLKASS
jgi:serine/threonine protein kinase/tetratricopeptide (TPR) repeat protein